MSVIISFKIHTASNSDIESCKENLVRYLWNVYISNKRTAVYTNHYVRMSVFISENFSVSVSLSLFMSLQQLLELFLFLESIWEGIKKS